MNSASAKVVPHIAEESDKVKPLLEVTGVVKRHGSFLALDGITFRMLEGEIISVLGPSGCGKSTLLRLIAGLADPDEGEIRLQQVTVASPKHRVPPEKRGVNMVFQDYALWPHLNVRDNIAYGLKRKGASRSEAALRVAELVRMLRLEGLESRLPPQLSGGQQQRVAIARALATRPKLLLLDEPFSNLDMRLRVEMRSEMAYLFRKLGISAIHVTHDPEEAFAMADQLMLMRGGKIDQIGKPQECYAKPASRWAASLLGAMNRIAGAAFRTPHGLALRSGSLVLEAVAPGEGRIADGSRAEICYRPEDVRITAHYPPSAAHKVLAQGPGKPNELLFNVKFSNFEGKRWRIAAELPDGQGAYLFSDRPMEPQAVLRAVLPKEAAYLYESEEGL